MNTLSSLFEFIGNTIGADPSTLKTTTKTLVGGINEMWEIVYPVGSYYETSDTSFDPNVSWGGTWSLETEGLVHIGAGANYTAGDTGGSKDAIVVSHSHSFSYKAQGTSADGTTETGGSLSGSGYKYRAVGSSYSWYNMTGTNSTGSSGTDANMQPYVVVNRWHRTA